MQRDVGLRIYYFAYMNSPPIFRVPSLLRSSYSNYELKKRESLLCKHYCVKRTRSLITFVVLLPANCISPLGLESGEIKDEALSHSLPPSSDSKPQYIRLNLKVDGFPFGWYVSSSGSVDYLQVMVSFIFIF